MGTKGSGGYTETARQRHNFHTEEQVKRRTITTFPDTMGPRARRQAALLQKARELETEDTIVTVDTDMPLETSVAQSAKATWSPQKGSCAYRVLLSLGIIGAGPRSFMLQRMAPKHKESTVDDALAKLCKHGYIDRNPWVHNGPLAYSVTPEGQQELIRAGEVFWNKEGKLAHKKSVFAERVLPPASVAPLPVKKKPKKPAKAATSNVAFGAHDIDRAAHKTIESIRKLAPNVVSTNKEAILDLILGLEALSDKTNKEERLLRALLDMWKTFSDVYSEGTL